MGPYKALVARGPAREGQWRLETVTARALREDELLIRIVATGICLADLHLGDVAQGAGGHPRIYYPRVLGHEGSGYVDEIGSAVKGFQLGDAVLLSFNSCGHCYSCQENKPALCIHSDELNFGGDEGVYATEGSTDFKIGGSFFGQSSFASHAVVKERSAVNLQGLIDSDEDLKLLAPLGCGVQTGTGAIINTANVQAGQDVAVLGVGGVGQSAIMAARIRGCQRIIAIDRVPARLRLAQSVGATHVIDSSMEDDLVAAVLRITKGAGVHVSLDTTGVSALARESYRFVRHGGKILQVGLAQQEDKWDISMPVHMNSGKQIIGCVQGDAVPQEYIAKMIAWFKAGELPLQQLVTFYEVSNFQQAIEDMRNGRTTKPVLVWPEVVGRD
ncbi:Aryl-alcohol dehydrogenase [Cladophialophora carrionii]|uniref:Aryl-alcohol dehydrogenase n=1 Tax=Cladophialophora carrionii TaxID=86049 RepID=A0A1C1CP32_9EURO|nr:Aryl-alcohol dehydrogenase [Cladophialophora carrionii]